MTSQTDLAPYEAMRHAMVSNQLRTNGVNDPRIVAAMNSVARERYLPADVHAIAYSDTLIPLGRGRAANSPMATGRLLTQAQPQPTDRVLLIGAGGGYTAALLAELVASVVAVESDPVLAERARAALAGVTPVELVEAPLEQGWPAGAPYDLLMIDGAVGFVPDTLVEQVAPGGRVVAGINDAGVTRLAFGRRSEGGFGMTDFADVDCAALPGFTRPRGFVF